MPLLLRILAFLEGIYNKFTLIGIFTFLSDLAYSIISSVTDKLGRVAPALAAYSALIITATIGYLTSVHFLLSSIDRAVPSIVLDVWGWVMPDNALGLLSAYYAAKLIKWAHVKYVNVVSFKTDIVLK